MYMGRRIYLFSPLSDVSPSYRRDLLQGWSPGAVGARLQDKQEQHRNVRRSARSRSRRYVYSVSNKTQNMKNNPLKQFWENKDLG